MNNFDFKDSLVQILTPWMQENNQTELIITAWLPNIFDPDIKQQQQIIIHCLPKEED